MLRGQGPILSHCPAVLLLDPQPACAAVLDGVGLPGAKRHRRGSAWRWREATGWRPVWSRGRHPSLVDVVIGWWHPATRTVMRQINRVVAVTRPLPASVVPVPYVRIAWIGKPRSRPIHNATRGGRRRRRWQGARWRPSNVVAEIRLAVGVVVIPRLIHRPGGRWHSAIISRVQHVYSFLRLLIARKRWHASRA